LASLWVASADFAAQCEFLRPPSSWAAGSLAAGRRVSGTVSGRHSQIPAPSPPPSQVSPCSSSSGRAAAFFLVNAGGPFIIHRGRNPRRRSACAPHTLARPNTLSIYIYIYIYFIDSISLLGPCSSGEAGAIGFEFILGLVLGERQSHGLPTDARAATHEGRRGPSVWLNGKRFIIFKHLVTRLHASWKGRLGARPSPDPSPRLAGRRD